MSYELTCDWAEDCLRIRVDGEWPASNPKDIIAEIYDLWVTHSGKRGLLLDIRNMQDTPTVLGDYQHAALFAEAGFIQIGQIAVLDNSNRKEANNFFESTAFNRGQRFRFFYVDEQQALNWILPMEQNQS